MLRSASVISLRQLRSLPSCSDWNSSEFELIDVFFGKRHRWAGDDDVLLAKLALPKFSSFKFRARRRRELFRRQQIAQMTGQISFVIRAPQRKRPHRSVLDK